MGNTRREAHLAFVTDGDIGQLAGIALIVRELERRWSTTSTWIASPPQARQLVGRFFASVAPGPTLHQVRSRPSPKDRYAVQMDLAEVCERLPADDRLVCLDYDHLIASANPADLPDCGDRIVVSSERYGDVAEDLNPHADRGELAVLPEDSYANTSFLCGRVSVLRAVSAEWRSAYEHVLPRVRLRRAVEAAFALSAARQAVKLERAEVSLQGSFSSHLEQSYLFHYGGDSPGARRMKDALTAMARSVRLDGGGERAMIPLRREMMRMLVHERRGG